MAVAIIAIMSALLTPAVRGLLGVTGPRGGVNTLSAALEQARLSAMENGVPSYVGWAETADAASSSLIVFRDKKDDEATEYVAVTRWLKLPQGVFLEPDSGSSSFQAGGSLPKLNGNAVGSIEAIRFDRFGRLYPATDAKALRVGAKDSPTGAFKPDANKSFFEVTIQPLTGRAVVVDKAMEES